MIFGRRKELGRYEAIERELIRLHQTLRVTWSTVEAQWARERIAELHALLSKSPDPDNNAERK